MRDILAGGSVHLAIGTYGVAAIRTLAEAHAKAGQVLVAAPELGRPDLAASGQLGIVAAGPPGVRETMRALAGVDRPPTFQSETECETATAIKLANSMVSGAAIAAQVDVVFAGTLRLWCRSPGHVRSHELIRSSKSRGRLPKRTNPLRRGRR